jgi:hypothetical protein
VCHHHHHHHHPPPPPHRGVAGRHMHGWPCHGRQDPPVRGGADDNRPRPAPLLTHDGDEPAELGLPRVHRGGGERRPAQPLQRAVLVLQPTVEQPTVEQPTVEQPTVEQPTVEQPTVEQPTVEQPTVEQPTPPAARRRVSSWSPQARSIDRGGQPPTADLLIYCARERPPRQGRCWRAMARQAEAGISPRAAAAAAAINISTIDNPDSR